MVVSSWVIRIVFQLIPWCVIHACRSRDRDEAPDHKVSPLVSVGWTSGGFRLDLGEVAEGEWFESRVLLHE